MKPQLAGKFVEEKVAKRLPLIGQTKFDGIRIFMDNGIAYTRSLEPARSEQLQSFAAHNRDMLQGLDGEVICGDPTAMDCYRRTSSSVMSFNKPDDELKFVVFDKFDEPAPFQDRYELASEIVSSFTMEASAHMIELADNTLLTTMEEIWEFHDQMCELGHEGIILRDPNSFYKYGRGSPVKCECIKMKEGGWVDTEVRIVDFHEEMENTNEQTTSALGYSKRSGHKENLVGKGTLGAFEVEGTFEDGRPFRCRVGTGLDHALRKAVWENPSAYKDLTVKMGYFKIGIKDKPRFTRFLGFRDEHDMDQGDLFDGA